MGYRRNQDAAASMTNEQAATQAAEYRKAADEYRKNGDTFVASCFCELANRIDAILKAREYA